MHHVEHLRVSYLAISAVDESFPESSAMVHTFVGIPNPADIQPTYSFSV
jgi:hypothetical protein